MLLSIFKCFFLSYLIVFLPLFPGSQLIDVNIFPFCSKIRSSYVICFRWLVYWWSFGYFCLHDLFFDYSSMWHPFPLFYFFYKLWPFIFFFSFFFRRWWVCGHIIGTILKLLNLFNIWGFVRGLNYLIDVAFNYWCNDDGSLVIRMNYRIVL